VTLSDVEEGAILRCSAKAEDREWKAACSPESVIVVAEKRECSSRVEVNLVKVLLPGGGAADARPRQSPDEEEWSAEIRFQDACGEAVDVTVDEIRQLNPSRRLDYNKEKKRISGLRGGDVRVGITLSGARATAPRDSTIEIHREANGQVGAVNCKTHVDYKWFSSTICQLAENDNPRQQQIEDVRTRFPSCREEINKLVSGLLGEWKTLQTKSSRDTTIVPGDSLKSCPAVGYLRVLGLILCDGRMKKGCKKAVEAWEKENPHEDSRGMWKRMCRLREL
jgi:hypothetical protein